MNSAEATNFLEGLIERLAAIEHERWSYGWTLGMISRVSVSHHAQVLIHRQGVLSFARLPIP